MIVCWNSSTPSPRLYALVRTYVYSGVCIVIITDEGNRACIFTDEGGYTASHRNVWIIVNMWASAYQRILGTCTNEGNCTLLRIRSNLWANCGLVFANNYWGMAPLATQDLSGQELC